MAFTALANSAGSSRLPGGGSGRRVSSSPPAMRRVASVASTRGSARLLLRRTATTAAPTTVTAAATRNQRPDGPRGANRPLLTTTMTMGERPTSAAEVAAAHALSPTRPLLVPVATRTSGSRSAGVSPSGSSARIRGGIEGWGIKRRTPMFSTPSNLLSRCMRPLARRGTWTSAAIDPPITVAKVVALFSRCSTVVS